MERLKIEEIVNNYGMHLKDFAERKLLADQINFALDFGMEYYQVGFQFLFIKKLESIGLSVHKIWIIPWDIYLPKSLMRRLIGKPKKFVLDEQISEIDDRLTNIEIELKSNTEFETDRY